MEEAYAIDKASNDTVSKDAINKEMNQMSVSFDILEENQRPSPNHKHVRLHLIFDVKMDFTRKSRLVTEWCSTPDTVNSTYAGVVSRESVFISFTYAALNDLNVWVGDVQDAYLQAPWSEKYYTILGPEHQGKKSIIVRAVYGLKCFGADYRNHMRVCMWNILTSHASTINITLSYNCL